MNIDKAIEILELECTSHKLKSDPDYLAAAKLGIEALKRCKAAKVKGTIWDQRPLPGEALEGR